MNNKRKHAQSLIEYGLIIALAAIVAVTILNKLSGSVSSVGNETNSAVNGSGGNALNGYCQTIGKTYNAGTNLCE